MSGLSSEYNDLGQMVALARKSSNHRNWSISDVMRLFWPPIIKRQYRIFKAKEYKTNESLPDGNIPIGFVTWACMNAESIDAYVNKTRKLRPSDYDSGDQVWVIDFVAPHGGVVSMVKDMQTELTIRYPDQTIGRWIRNNMRPDRRLGYGKRTEI